MYYNCIQVTLFYLLGVLFLSKPTRLYIIFLYMYKWPSSRAGEPEPGVFGSLEPELLEKKQGAGATWKKSPEPVKN